MISRFRIGHELQQFLAGTAAKMSHGSAVVHDHDPVRRGGRVEIVGDHDDHLSLIGHSPEGFENDLRALRIQSTRRLVREHDTGVACERPAERCSLLFTTGEQAGWCAAATAQAERLDEVPDQVMGCRFVVEQERKSNVLLNGEEGHQMEPYSQPSSSAP